MGGMGGGGRGGFQRLEEVGCLMTSNSCDKAVPSCSRLTSAVIARVWVNGGCDSGRVTFKESRYFLQDELDEKRMSWMVDIKERKRIGTY